MKSVFDDDITPRLERAVGVTILDDMVQIDRVLTHVLHHQITATHRAREGVTAARDRARKAIDKAIAAGIAQRCLAEAPDASA